MTKRILVQCSTRVARNAVRRETIDGVEHVIISSFTLPDNVVMNGGLYPSEERDKSFKTLERTLAPVEHPTDAAGNFISASDPTAIHNFYAGAFNQNVRKEGGRIAVDKVINVQEARKTERGKRLLDRVEELETNDNARPIHTSVGVFLEVEPLEAPQHNGAGDEFTWIARNMFFDHDAILLDSVGAAQPHQGVGMAVNASGDEFEVQQALVTIDGDRVEEMSHQEIRDALNEAIRVPPFNGDWVVDVFDNTVIFESGPESFSATYEMVGRTAKIVDVPLPVVRDVTYIPKTNTQEGDAMRELMLKALADAGVTVNADISDADLMAKYNEHLAGQTENPGGDQPTVNTDGVAAVVNEALQPVLSKLDGLEQKVNQKDDEERKRLAGIVGNSDKYPGLTAEKAEALGFDTLKEMAANCGTAFGLSLNHNDTSGSDGLGHAYDMPQ